MTGFEPVTDRLKVCCSTNWATSSYLLLYRHFPTSTGRVETLLFYLIRENKFFSLKNNALINLINKNLFVFLTF